MIRVKNVSAYLDEPFILRMRVVPRSEQISSSLFGDGDFFMLNRYINIRGGTLWQNFITIK